MKKYIFMILSLLTMLFIYACDTDKTVDSHEEHADAVGMRILSSGAVLTSYVRTDTAEFKAIELTEGEESPHLDIEFYDDEHEEWFVPETADHYSLQIVIADTSITDYEQHEGEEGSFEFHLHGKKPGNTSAVFRIMHDDHADFESRPLRVEVVSAAQ
jgi:hypothetical protein